MTAARKLGLAGLAGLALLAGCRTVPGTTREVPVYEFVNVTTVPAGAQLFVDGVRRGQTPADVRLTWYQGRCRRWNRPWDPLLGLVLLPLALADYLIGGENNVGMFGQLLIGEQYNYERAGETVTVRLERDGYEPVRRELQAGPRGETTRLEPIIMERK